MPTVSGRSQATAVVPEPSEARPVYLDCNATAPLDPRVRSEIMHYLDVDYGNAGSRTHQYGQTAKERVQRARDQVARVVQAQPDEVIFTSGATEANNLSLLGLASHADSVGRRHVIGTAIEHKAVLEPLEELAYRGYDMTLVPPTSGGWVDPEAIRSALRPETVLVTVMHVNNETGVVQPLDEIAQVLHDHDAYLHVDAAQGFGKDLDALQNKRVDLISVSGHKIYGPKGIGALIARRRGFERVPLTPLMRGGGQERGLRPGTLPVALIAGLGAAAEIAMSSHQQRAEYCRHYKDEVLAALAPLNPRVNGDLERTLPHTINVSFPGVDSEGAMLALKDLVAISNGSACTSQSYDPSHVLTAMGLPPDRISEALRISWCHMSDVPDWERIVERIAALRST